MELLEREEFLHVLRQEFRETLSGEGRSVFVTGEAGIGKSSLVRCFLKEVENKSRTFIASCDSLFTPRPLGVLYDLAPQIEHSLANKIKRPNERPELFAEFVKAVSDYTEPVVLVMEDIHWADEASLDFIKFFARRIGRTSCLFVLTYRDDEITLQHPLRNVLGELPAGTFTRIALTRLSKNSVQTLANSKGYKGEDVYAITGGNPFYVTEILASYSEGIPENIKDAVLAVYNRLKDNTKHMWEVLSIMPEGLEHTWLAKIDPEWQEAIEVCFNKGILLIRNNRTVFKHELFRRTIESALSPFKRLELNRKVLELFSESFEKSGAIERIVHYAKNAAENKMVTQFAPMAAAQAAAVGAHTEAAKLYLAAIEYCIDKDPQHLVQLYESYTYECYLTNQIKEAIIYQTKAFKIWQVIGDSEKLGNCLRFLSRLWWYDGHGKEAESYAVQAIETFENLPPSKAKAMAYSNLSQLRMLSDDLEGCITWGTKAVEMAMEIGDEEIRSHALNNIGAARMRVPELQTEGKKLLEESLQIALNHSFHEHAARAYTNLISGSISSKDYDVAEDYLEKGMQYCGSLDLHSWAWYKLSCKARILLEKGDWESAESLSESQLSSSIQPGIVRIGGLTIRATIRIRSGKEDGLVLLREAKTLAYLLNEHLRIIPVVIPALEFEWLSGNRLLNDEELDIALSLIKNSNNIWLNSEADFWLKKVRGIDVALPDLFEPYHCLQQGNSTRAATFWKEKGCPYETAIALFAGTEDQKREALTILQKLGAERVYEKLKSEMRSSGINKIPRGLRSSTLSNPAQLTAREIDILELLKTGASNKEIAANLFISPKTVDHHISSILFKLDAQSRVKAVSQATKLGILK